MQEPLLIAKCKCSAPALTERCFPAGLWSVGATLQLHWPEILRFQPGTLQFGQHFRACLQRNPECPGPLPGHLSVPGKKVIFTNFLWNHNDRKLNTVLRNDTIHGKANATDWVASFDNYSFLGSSYITILGQAERGPVRSCTEFRHKKSNRSKLVSSPTKELTKPYVLLTSSNRS